MTAKQTISEEPSGSSGVYALRAASMHRLRQAQSEQDRSAILTGLQAIWDALRNLVNAVLRAFGLKQSVAARSIASEEDISAQANSIQSSLKAAEDGMTATGDKAFPDSAFAQALRSFGFDAFQQTLLEQVRQPHALGDPAINRLVGPVFSTAAQNFRGLDDRLLRQRQDLATLANSLIPAFGGPPLLVEDVVSMCRQLPVGSYPAGQSSIIASLLSLDDSIREASAHRAQIVVALKDFAACARKAGGDLSGSDSDLRCVIGQDWDDQVTAAVAASAVATAQDVAVGGATEAVAAQAESAKPQSAALTPLQRLRAMSQRADAHEPMPAMAAVGDDGDDDDDYVASPRSTV